MGQYFGDVWIPFVADFNIDDASRNIKVIKHVDSSVLPHIAEFENPVKTLNMGGTVIPVSTSDKTADDYIEDILALLTRPSIDNYIVDFCGRSGFLSVASIKAPKTADNPISRDYTATGNFMAMRDYIPTLKANPKVMPNDFGFELGVDDVDCYVSMPIGAIYVSGGDDYAITYPSEDGILALSKATDDPIYQYDLSSQLVNAGEVKMFDTCGEALEADWMRVWNKDHEFTGDMVITNAQYRAIISMNDDNVTLQFFLEDVWYEMITIDCGSIIYPRVLKADMEEVALKLNANFYLTVTRAMPVYVNTGTETLNASASVISGNTTTDNWLIYDDTGNGDYYICSNESFSISGTNLGTGKKWFFRNTSTLVGKNYAHIVMVERNLTRYLGVR